MSFAFPIPEEYEALVINSGRIHIVHVIVDDF
jgi:hypothetical protein